ncbi:MAG: serine--tRNA ligase [Bdellovibrionales bacterium]|nr:serine--tRNA ligase [Bdellovibrionales bacterium]
MYLKNLEDEGYFKSYEASLKKRNGDLSLLQKIMEMNQVRKKSMQESESKKAHQNKVSEQIAQLKRQKQDASALLTEMQALSQEVKGLEKQTKDIEEEVRDLLSSLPNKLNDNVPAGTSEQDNQLIRTVGEPTKFSFKAKEHGEIGEKLKILDFDRGAKVAGARFTFLMGLGARLERAISSFMMDLHSEKHGYREAIPPYMVNSHAMYGTGNFPKFKEDVFHLSGTDYYLIPTAEVPVTNFYNGEVLNESDLPQRFAAYSSCFRSEAGSYGKDVKGLIRQHQFQKVELMCFVHPDKSYEEHERLTTNAEEVLNQLEIPYRRMLLCSGDIGPNSAKTYDLEAWLPGQQAYREISSCSNFEDFQARRADIRFKPQGGGKPQFVHTLNGSGLAIGRTLVAILENYQQEDGSVKVPKVLQRYMGCEVIK